MPYFSKTTYDKLKFLTQILLPALGTLYFALAGIWGLPAADQVVGTVLAVDTFLGVLLGLSTASYNNSEERFDGAIDILGGDDENRHFRLNVPLDASEIENAEELRIKIQRPEDSAG